MRSKSLDLPKKEMDGLLIRPSHLVLQSLKGVRSERTTSWIGKNRLVVGWFVDCWSFTRLVVSRFRHTRPRPLSRYHLGGIAEKFDSIRFSTLNTFCLENGSLHRGGASFEIKRTTLIG